MAFDPPNRHLDSAGDLLISTHPGSDGLPCPTYVRKVGTSAPGIIYRSSRPALAVAAAFAVALAVLVSTPGTAEAEVRYTLTGSSESPPLSRSNGDTVYITATGTAYVKFAISTVGSAKASFTHSSADQNGQVITCREGDPCDADKSNATGGGVQVAMKIANDSGAGAIFVTRTLPGSPATDPAVDEIGVSVAQVPTKLTAKPNVKAINSSGEGTAGTTYVDIRLTDASGKGIASKELTVVSTRATLATATVATRTVGDDTVALGAYTGATLAGNVTTSTDPTENTSDGAGYARVQVTGAGSPGIATITVTYNELTATANIVLYGRVTKIAAVAEQSAIEQGGKTFIVVTATDAGGNPVAGHNVNVKSGASGVVGPAEDAAEVTFSNEENKDAAPVGTLGKGDLPACGDVTAVEADPTTTPPTVAVAASEGTNDEGKCVIRIDAGSAAGTDDDASRGTHTVTIQGPKADGSTDVKLEIQVGGAPASITSDAPQLLSPSEELTVNLTVRDDEGVRVGRTSIEVLETVQYGALLTEPTTTSDGRAKFSYLAPSTPGVVEFLVRTKGPDGKVTARLPIIIRIAETMDDPDETGPTAPAAPEFVRISRSADGTLRVTTSPPAAGLTVEAEVSSNDGASWTAVPSGAPDAGEYIGRARFAMGELVSSWAYSPNSVVVAAADPDDPPPPPTDPEPSISGAVPSAPGESGLVIINNVDNTAELVGLFDCDAPTVTLSSDGGLVRYAAGVLAFVNERFIQSGVLPTSGPTPAFATCE